MPPAPQSPRAVPSPALTLHIHVSGQFFVLHLPASSAPLNNTLGNLFPQIILLSSDDHRPLHQDAHSYAPYSGTCIAPQGFVPHHSAAPDKAIRAPVSTYFPFGCSSTGLGAYSQTPISSRSLLVFRFFDSLPGPRASLSRPAVASRASFNRQTHCLQRVQSLQLAPKALSPGLRKEIRHTSSLFHVKHRTWTSTNDLPAFYNGA